MLTLKHHAEDPGRAYHFCGSGFFIFAVFSQLTQLILVQLLTFFHRLHRRIARSTETREILG